MRALAAVLVIAVLAGPRALARDVLFRVDGPAQHAELGFSLATCPDVDGDGVADLVSGSDECPTAAGKDAGAVFLVSGRTGAVIRRIDGTEASANLGFSVAVVGDLDGDGAPEIVAGEHWSSPDDVCHAGRARVFSARDGSEALRFDGARRFGELGYAVAGPGDLDGDSIPDVVAAEIDDAVRAFSGATGELLWAVRGLTRSTTAGLALAAGGDIDRDGAPDVIVGSPGRHGAAGSDCGAVFVVSGRTGRIVRSMPGTLPGAELGTAVASAGDVDDDGVPDVAAGAPRADEGLGRARCGGFIVFSGASGDPIFRRSGISGGDRLGSAIASCGDLDGDGRRDLLVGARDASPRALTHAGSFFGWAVGGARRPVFRVDGARFGMRLGKSLAGAPDLDGDGVPDVAAGADEWSAKGRPGSGAVFAFSSAGE